MPIKLVLPRAAQLGIHFLKEKQLLFLGVPVLGHITEDRQRKTVQHQAVIEPTTSQLQGMHSTSVL